MDKKRESFFMNARSTEITFSNSSSAIDQDISKSGDLPSFVENEIPEDYDTNSNMSETKSRSTWMNKALNPNVTNEYFKRGFPRVSLRGSIYKTPGPLSIQSSKNENKGDRPKDGADKSPRRTRNIVLLVLFGLFLVAIIAIPIIVIESIMKDSIQEPTNYYRVVMKLLANGPFTTDLSDTQSPLYQTFTSVFCKEIDKVYQNQTQYEACLVNRLRNGSIEVEFSVYVIVSTEAEANKTVSILETSLSNSQVLGPIPIINNSFSVVGVEQVNGVPQPLTVSVATTSILETTIHEDISTTVDSTTISLEGTNKPTSPGNTVPILTMSQTFDDISTFLSTDAEEKTTKTTVGPLTESQQTRLPTSADSTTSIVSSGLDVTDASISTAISSEVSTKKQAASMISVDSSVVSTDNPVTETEVSSTQISEEITALTETKTDVFEATANARSTTFSTMASNIAESTTSRIFSPEKNITPTTMFTTASTELSTKTEETKTTPLMSPDNQTIENTFFSTQIQEETTLVGEQTSRTESFETTAQNEKRTTVTSTASSTETIKSTTEPEHKDTYPHTATSAAITNSTLNRVENPSSTMGIQHTTPTIEEQTTKEIFTTAELQVTELSKVSERNAPLSTSTNTGSPSESFTTLQSKTQSTMSTDTFEATTTAPLLGIICQDNTFECGKSGIFTCNITFSEFVEIVIVKAIGATQPDILATVYDNETTVYAEGVNFVIYYVPNQTLDLVFDAISVADEGTYDITVYDKTLTEKASGGEIIVQKLPTVPLLIMHPDQVIDLGYYRKDMENNCTADVGYPQGQLVIEVKYDDRTDFEIADIVVVENITTSENCSSTQYLKFGMLYPQTMENGKIRCRVETPVTSEIIFSEDDLLLIPRDICSNSATSLPSYPHPSVCNRFVTCNSDLVPTGTTCGDLCFDEKSFNCDYCKNVCPEIKTTDAIETTTDDVETTTADTNLLPLVVMNCTSISTFNGEGPANITCSFKLLTALLGVNISRIDGLLKRLIGSIESDGSVTDIALGDIQIKYTPSDVSTIVLTVPSSTCKYQANYSFFAIEQGNVSYIGSGELIAKVKPGRPVLHLEHQTVLNLPSKTGTCAVRGGNPAGKFVIEVMRHNETNYTVFDEYSNKTTGVKDNCNTNLTMIFSAKYSEELNNTKVRCRIDSDDTIDENEDLNKYRSNEEEIVLIKDDYCNGDVQFKKHPRDGCHFFVECDGAQIISRPCNDLCFNGETSNCDYCTNVNDTCNLPT